MNMNVKQITSAQNSSYKQALRYQNSRDARKAGVFLVEGVRAVTELLQAPQWEIESLWLSQERLQTEDAFKKLLDQTVSKEQVVYELPQQLLVRLADTQSPQGVLAVVKRQEFSLSQLMAKKTGAPFYIMLENLQDPGNVGTILRTADSAGADGILYTRGTVDIYHAKVVRAAMGSVLHMPLCQVASVQQAAELLHRNGVRLLAAHLKGESYHFQEDLKGPIGVMIGNEGAGLSEEATMAADALVKIPMLGRAESLNAAMAAGILIYEAVRQRME